MGWRKMVEVLQIRWLHRKLALRPPSRPTTTTVGVVVMVMLLSLLVLLLELVLVLILMLPLMLVLVLLELLLVLLVLMVLLVLVKLKVLFCSARGAGPRELLVPLHSPLLSPLVPPPRPLCPARWAGLLVLAVLVFLVPCQVTNFQLRRTRRRRPRQ